MSRAHKQLYKNAGLDSSEMRRRREEAGVQLRKAKREEQLFKRRNIEAGPSPQVHGVGMELGSSSSSGDQLEHNTRDTHMSEGTGEDLGGMQAQASDQSEEEQYQSIMDDAIQMLYSEMEPDQINAIQKFRLLVSCNSYPPIDEIIQKGVVPKFVSLLSNPNATLQFEAAWTLTNIASGSSNQTKVIVEAGVVPLFIEMLSSPHTEVQEQAAWALGNIAGDSPTFRDHVIDSGVLMPLLNIMEKSECTTMLRTTVWTLSNLCRGVSVDFSKSTNCLPILARLLGFTDELILTDTCWAISYISDGPHTRIQSVIDSGVCPRLIELLLHPKPTVGSAALRAVGNIVTGDDKQTQVILDCNALTCISHFLLTAPDTVKKELCWTISNIAAGNRQQIQEIINANLFPEVVHIMRTAHFHTRKEAAWAIRNAVGNGSGDQINYLVQIGCVPPMCDFLRVGDLDIIQVALNTLENILSAGEKLIVRPNPYAIIIEECGGLDKIEHLQAHANSEIYMKSYYILEEYFRSDEEEATSVAPVALNQEFQFNPHMPEGGYNF